MQQVGSYLRHTGRAHIIVARAARNPNSAAPAMRLHRRMIWKAGGNVLVPGDCDMRRRDFISFLGTAIAWPRAAAAQTWPSGNIRIVVPYPPAGSTDVIARLVQNGLQQRLGVNVIVDNRAGASGSIGTASVAKSPPDGNTWLFVFDNHGANPFVLPTLPYDTEKDLDPVLLIGTAPYVIATHPGRPFRTLADIIAAAKRAPNTISYASVGSGSVGHLAMAKLSNQAGVQLVHVPYRGGGPAMNDVVAGHVDLLVGSTALSIPQLQAGAIRPVAQTGITRASALASAPTVAESGFAGFEAYAWWGVFAPAGTPKAMIERFGADLILSLRDERVLKQVAETQQVALRLGGPEELRKFLAEQMRIWGPVARENNIKGEG
jgi:tripartite-type tricarboxylate transporter receptor subunit TctC